MVEVYGIEARWEGINKDVPCIALLNWGTAENPKNDLVKLIIRQGEYTTDDIISSIIEYYDPINTAIPRQVEQEVKKLNVEIDRREFRKRLDEAMNDA